jgi:hypothetical protein
MTNTVLKAQIDSQITNETLSNSISPADVGGNLKAVVDYVGRNEYSFLITQTGTSAPIENAVLINNSGLTFTMVRTDIGRCEIIPSVAQNQDKVGCEILRLFITVQIDS